jgi:hypothetical protein
MKRQKFSREYKLAAVKHDIGDYGKRTMTIKVCTPLKRLLEVNYGELQ